MSLLHSDFCISVCTYHSRYLTAIGTNHIWYTIVSETLDHCVRFMLSQRYSTQESYRIIAMSNNREEQRLQQQQLDEERDSIVEGIEDITGGLKILTRRLEDLAQRVHHFPGASATTGPAAPAAATAATTSTYDYRYSASTAPIEEISFLNSNDYDRQTGMFHNSRTCICIQPPIMQAYTSILTRKKILPCPECFKPR